MENNNQNFIKCFNLLIRNDFKQAQAAFSEAYHTHPEKLQYFYGMFAAFILLKDLTGIMEILEKERKISIFKDKFSQILRFFRKNKIFENRPVYTVLYNTGIFLKEKFYDTEADIFFQVCEMINPANTKNLTALGELEILKGNYAKGINYFIKAADSTKA